MNKRRKGRIKRKGAIRSIAKGWGRRRSQGVQGVGKGKREAGKGEEKRKEKKGRESKSRRGKRNGRSRRKEMGKDSKRKRDRGK